MKTTTAPIIEGSNVTLDQLPGVGPKTLSYLHHLHLYVLDDLLFHLPLRYEDRTKIVALSQLQIGDRVMLEAQIDRFHYVGNGKRRQCCCYLSDGDHSIVLRFFHYNKSQIKQLSAVGQRLRCFGEVKQGYKGGVEMIHPEYRSINQSHELPLETCLTPIYPTTKGLRQSVLRKLMRFALSHLANHQWLTELLPETLLKTYHFMPLIPALHRIHFPSADTDRALLESRQDRSQQRLAFEELLAHRVFHLKYKAMVKSKRACALRQQQLQCQFIQQLPFTLTAGQQQVIEAINHDVGLSYPMLRLIQGDVGCGKTVIAIAAALNAIEAGHQAVLMAPTELLAEQHMQNCLRWLTPLGVTSCYLSGNLSAVLRRQSLAMIASGEAQMVVGTHALFQDDVEFSQLALFIVDEQHRFGVEQRLFLKQKGVVAGYHPHQLLMTATPIPRSLAMTLYGDLDISMITELPANRQAITTALISSDKRDLVLDRVREYCKKGCQVYWVCTLIEESETLQCQTVEATALQLQSYLPELNVELLHGKLPSADKLQVMNQFQAGDINVLVATTVIEVGVDVPNATVIVIENPERLGLAQLHQLRGRVGRGSLASYCLLLYQEPLTEIAAKRLAILRDSQDGFAIAQHDLDIRGPGEVLGTRQAGVAQLKVADWFRDKALFATVDQAANNLLASGVNVEDLLARWIGEKAQFHEV